MLRMQFKMDVPLFILYAFSQALWKEILQRVAMVQIAFHPHIPLWGLASPSICASMGRNTEQVCKYSF